MPQVQNWVKIGALLAFFFTALCCAALGIHVLAEDQTTKAGIATLIFNFNLSDIHLRNSLAKTRDITARALPFQSEVQSAVSILKTAVSSAAGAASTAVSDIEVMIPRNCSLGTEQFCVGFENKINCTDFPFNISSIVPAAVAKFVGDEVQPLQPLEGILAKVTLVNIRGCLILGLISIPAIVLIFVCLFFNFIPFAASLLKLVVCLVAVFCWVLFLGPYLILHYTQSEIQHFKSIVGVEEGNVNNWILGAVISAGAMMLSTIVISRFM